MTKPKQYGANRQIRFTDELWDRLEEFRSFVKNKTGVNITYSEAIRSLLDEALNSRGLNNEHEHAQKNRR